MGISFVLATKYFFIELQTPTHASLTLMHPSKARSIARNYHGSAPPTTARQGTCGDTNNK